MFFSVRRSTNSVCNAEFAFAHNLNLVLSLFFCGSLEAHQIAETVVPGSNPASLIVHTVKPPPEVKKLNKKQ